MVGMISILLFHISLGPEFKVAGEKQAEHLIGGVSYRIQARHDGPHGGASNVINGNPVFFQSLDDTHMGHPLGSASAQYQPNALGFCRAYEQVHEQDHHTQTMPPNG